MEYTYAVKIAALPASIWAVLTDVERWPEWTPSMTLIRRLDDGPFAVGSRARVEQPGSRTLVWTVTELEPDRSFVWTASTTGITLTARHQLSEADSSVSVDNSLVADGWAARIVTAMIGGRLRRYVRMETEGLKQRCEVPSPTA
ncbi:MAG: SRPBCC family protein [Nocardioidaceae bacterium]